MNPSRDLAKYLLFVLSGAPACAEREPQPTQTPADENENLRERKADRDREFATPPGDRESCEYSLTNYCFAPGELQKILKDCKEPKSNDDNGCLALASYRACSKTIVDGPRMENGQCCYSSCQPPALPGGRPLMTCGT